MMQRETVNPGGAEVVAAPDPALPAASFNSLETAVRRGIERLYLERCSGGNWCYEFEADCTIPSEFILMVHFMGDLDMYDEIGIDAEEKLARYIRRHQQDDGGWPLFEGGAFDMSCSVKAYYALKLAGDVPGEPHMERARARILAGGGAVRTNVFTHLALALFGQVPWTAVPFIPVELILFPSWFPFHLSKVSYWSRAVMVPLSVLCSLKAKAKNPRGISIAELFIVSPNEEQDWFPVRSLTNRAFLLMDRLGHFIEPMIPRAVRGRALDRATHWIGERVVGEDGLGAIFPAMVNAHEALAAVGLPENDHRRISAREALKRLPVLSGDQAYVQPCVSPVWDTALAVLAAQDAADIGSDEVIIKSLDWLADKQLSDEPGDWRDARPNLAGGGWPFQYDNPYYPDIDDTAAVGWAMCLADRERYQENIQRAANWVAGMQSKNGGFGAFDVDNTSYYLNEIPFADHGALLDPPTADVTGRCLAFLALADREGFDPLIKRAVTFLEREQESTGSWFGRWGTNYIYGTWSVLVALELAGYPRSSPVVRRAVTWLHGVQRDDGGWGESNDSYADPRLAGLGSRSTSFQTAWALLALMAAGETQSQAVVDGVRWLQRTQRSDGLWQEPDFTAPGFPRVFYLKYHGYSRYFPLWALGRYYQLTGVQ
jgi:squalene-hopene/tetraprenyl-beta-curcumene cyclase